MHILFILSDSSNVRLVDGPGPWNGRLEIKSNGVWGSVCWDSWNQSNTNVVCETLGFRYVFMSVLLEH